MDGSMLSVCPRATAVPLSFLRSVSSLPSFPTVSEAFYHYASAQPSAVAAWDLSAESHIDISYGELVQRSVRLAQRLRNLGVVPGDWVPLVVKRGVGMLVGILTISCGAQYVPLNGSVVADEALRFVLKQTGGRTVLALKSTCHRVSSSGATNVVVIVDLEDAEEQDVEKHEDHTTSSNPDDGCYVIYTSGATGTPREAGITHRNATNFVCQAPSNFGISPFTRIGQVLNVSFDMAAWETLGCLANGGILGMSGSNWSKALQQIDILIRSPSILAKHGPQDYPNLKAVATAGEPSSQRLADICAAYVTCISCYGPTETTVVNIMHRHQPGQPLSIERPTPGNKGYILDESLVPVTVGEVGVSWAGSSEVSRGYVDLPVKAAERFRFDPFSQDRTKMYDTRDLYLWNPSGTIILGHVDDQVKVKGFCVGLDGVIAALSLCPSVQGAAALLTDGEIHAFVAPRHCPLPVIQNYLKVHQPYYAIPTRCHFFDALPLTENGKLDKKALRHVASSPQEPTSTFETAPYSQILQPKPALLGHSRSDSSASSATQASSFSDLSDATLVEEQVDLEAALPDKKHCKYSRGLRYRVLIIYRRLFSLVGLFNISAAIALAMTGISREWLSNITAINLATALLVRQEFVINALYTIACSVPKSWPLFIRARCAKIYHLGGVHSGAAVSAGAWLLAANIADIVCMVSGKCSNWGKQSTTSKIISWTLSAFVAVMIGLAWPSMRKRHHDLFERTHRFIGWTMLAFFWVQVVLAIKDNAAAGASLGEACVRSPPFWLLAVATASVASSWLSLRKVAVQAEKMSDHAIRLHFEYTVPVNGSFTRISYHPLIEWHSFATIPAPEAVNGRPKGYSLIVSNAGDWTKSTIQDGPSHIWIRGVPTCGVMRIATLFNRVVLIATGSGIGPMLGHIQNPPCGTQLIWSTKQPEETFGEDLCRTVTERVPSAIIHDTKKQGRPDLVKMGYNLAKSFKAEAVIIIANEKITRKVVYGLETRGVPAYGAIWDS